MAHDGNGAGGMRPSSLAAFEGTWRLEKEITQADGPEGRFSGLARFTRSGPGTLVMEEDGTLVLGDAPPLAATRRYLWRERAGMIEVSFDDNRPFHAIPLSAERPEAIHLCQPDRYHVLYDFGSWPLWTATWQVEGPRKSYVMRSEFRR